MSEPSNVPVRDAQSAFADYSSNGHVLAGLFQRLAAALRSSVPFKHAELALREHDDVVRVYTVDAESAESVAEFVTTRQAFSPRLWPQEPGPVMVGVASIGLDTEYEADRVLLARGVRSVLAAPLDNGQRRLGLFTLASAIDDAFVPSHAATVEPVVELLVAAVERERLWDLDQARQRRRAKLEALLPVIGEALDVRQVFLGMSAVIQDVIPHDILAFALLAPDRRSVSVQAATHAGLREMPEYRFSNEEEALDARWNFLLANDLSVEPDGRLRVRISTSGAPEPVDVILNPGVAWTRFITTTGVRSTLRVPIHAKDRPIGGVAFFSCRPYAYDADDGALASRIADHLALALAHQSLAAEERRVVQARARELELATRIEVLSRELEQFSAHRAVGQSPQWLKVMADATQVAATEATVLITGESGTGKEVVARFIHRGSPRASGPFVAINCAALPEQLLESELFGHERGAFTGALTARPGKLEQAAGGVLFLDEVGEMSPTVQAKFLRVLQEREFQRLGGAKVLRADVRVVAATNRDPQRGMATGTFREDLYYRLSVFEIQLPSLRERPKDILLLAEAFRDEIAASMGRPAPVLAHDARTQLLAYEWPGNVRELRNTIERAVIVATDGVILREHLPMTIARAAPVATVMKTAIEEHGVIEHVAPLVDVERDLLQKALLKASDNKSQAAKLLQISRGQLYSLMKRHGLTKARR